MKFSAVAGIVLDMDGVLWRGEVSLPGMQELFQWLDETGKPFVLATNNSGKTPADYVAKLGRMGVFSVAERNIITSGTATAAYMQTRYMPGTEVMVVGMSGLKQILSEAGYDVVEENPKVVVAGIDFDLSYEKLRRAALSIRAGADFIGTNPDVTFPSPEGLVPGAGSIIAAIQTATDVEPVVIGKPAHPMYEAAIDVLGTKPADTLMVGDRINTDIIGAQEMGMQTALVFTGVTTPEDLQKGSIWPDVAYDGLPELLKAWAGFEWYNEKQKAKREQS